MSEYSGFRGLAGEVIVSFVMPATIFQAIPVLIFFGLSVGLVAFALPEGLFPLDLLLILVMVSFAVSRYAIPAVNGDVEAGWFNEKNSNKASLDFSIRYVVFTISWALPVAAIMFAMAEFGDGFEFGAGPLSLVQSGFTGFLMLVLMLVFIFAPTLGFIAATATSDPLEIVKPALWRHLFAEQRANLVVFYASLIGGVITFWLIYAFPLLLLTMIGFAMSDGIGGFLAVFVFSLPVGMAPVLIGRLSGALIRGEVEDSQTAPPPSEPVEPAPQAAAPTLAAQPVRSSPGTPTSASSPRVPAASTNTPSPPPVDSSAAKDAYSQMVKKVENTTDVGVQNAILLASNRFRAGADNPYVADKICLLHVKAGQPEEATGAASAAIELAIASGAEPVALKCYVELRRAEIPLNLERDHQQKLVSLLVKAQQYQDALALMLELDVVTAQRLKTLSELAIKNSRKKDAVAIVTYLRDNFSDADFLSELVSQVKAM